MHKVMLIEDDDTMLSLIQLFLQLEGYEVVNFNEENTIEEVIHSIRRESPALVLLDVHLKYFNGFDLLRQIRQEADVKPVRVLMCSGMDLGMQCYQEGADGFILKPYMPEELASRIRETLGE